MGDGARDSVAEPDGSDAEADVSIEDAEASVEADIAALSRERDDLREMAQRVQADFENYRKRMLREQTEKIERANQALLEELLPVLDSFDLAVAGLADADQNVRKGVELVQTELLGVLAKGGLERIDVLGKPFDPHEHEAVAQEDGDGEPVVFDVLRSGYRLKGRVLRPATVRVTRAEQ
ncbi:MAG: nucleotide exchange factor GrpE [Actinobacteria bacterium]|nr:nucleotide exchange factor GrpE [Actinomycetota bacterium]